MNKEKLNQLVVALVGKELSSKWWDSPNKAFKSKTPSEAFVEDPVAVRDYLMWHCYGAMG